MMLQLKNNPKRSNPYLLMIASLVTVFVLFSFKSYYVPIEKSRNVLSILDTIPNVNTEKVKQEKMKTVDEKPKQAKVAKKSVKPELNEEATIKKHTEIIVSRDTIIDFNYESKEETIKVVENKMVKAYQMLIDAELQKPKPNYERIEKWRKEGTRN